MANLDFKPPMEQQANRLNQLLYTLARAYLQKGQFSEAYEKLKQLIQLENENTEFLLDAAIAGLALNDVTEPALALYQRALEFNPSSKALRLNLADFFLKHQLISPFAVELCESMLTQNPANEPQLRQFLKQGYEVLGMVDKARAEELRAIFAGRNSEAIRAYMEKFWWEGKFAEAQTVLQNAPAVNGAADYLHRELALTYAYEALTAERVKIDTRATESILAALARLVPGDAFLDWRDYLLLRHTLSAQAVQQWRKNIRREALPFAIAATALQHVVTEELELKQFEAAELLALLPAKESDAVEAAPWPGTIFLLTQITSPSNHPVPPRLIELLSSHLRQLPQTQVRVTGTCVVSFVPEVLPAIRAMVEFMQSLEDYNAAAPEAERVFLSSILREENEPQKLLRALVETSHLLQTCAASANAESGAGMLWLQASPAQYNTLKNHGVQVMSMPNVSWWSGQETACGEMLWRNPILQLKDGQQYEFGRYLIKQRLLRHTTYATYLATDLLMDRQILMKVMLPQASALFLQNERKRNHLFDRIKSVGRVCHPYLAFVHEMGEHEGMVYFTREYVEGKNLAEINIPEEQRDAEVLMLLQKIVRALKYAHDKGVVFMNLKPGNIWLSDAQELKITDFRIPGFNEDPSTANVLAPSHWRYQAPEILLEAKGDSRSDIYSLGVIAFELLAGRHPYTTSRTVNSPQDIPKMRITSLSEVDKRHHRAWDKFVMRALHLDPDRRFQSLEEMDEELRAIQAEMLEKALKVVR